MITSARIDALRELNDAGTATAFGWITALRAPAIATLAAEDGPLQMSLFDAQDLAEISHPDYPGERLIACRNPALAAERARKRNELLAATEADLAAIADRVAAGRLRGAGHIGEAIGRIIGKYKVGKHFRPHASPTPASPTTATRPPSTPKPPSTASTCYAPRCRPPNSTRPRSSTATRTWPTSNATSAASKPTTSTCGPSTTGSTERVRAHVLICLLACYLTWHLRKAWAPLTFTDEHPPTRDNPVAPAQRSTTAQAKASTPTRRRRHRATQLPRPARSPGHPDPQRDPLPRHQHRQYPCSPNPPPTNAAPSTSSVPPSP